MVRAKWLRINGGDGRDLRARGFCLSGLPGLSLLSTNGTGGGGRVGITQMIDPLLTARFDVERTAEEFQSPASVGDYFAPCLEPNCRVRKLVSQTWRPILHVCFLRPKSVQFVHHPPKCPSDHMLPLWIFGQGKCITIHLAENLCASFFRWPLELDDQMLQRSPWDAELSGQHQINTLSTIEDSKIWIHVNGSLD